MFVEELCFYRCNLWSILSDDQVFWLMFFFKKSYSAIELFAFLSNAYLLHLSDYCYRLHMCFKFVPFLAYEGLLV